jgi:serine/threonine-protein kinase
MSEVSADLLAALDELLKRALEVAPSERDEWLARLRTESPAHARELETLLAEEAELDARGFLSGERPAPDREEQGLAGQRLGGWTLERPLGHGGMGTVWLARRSDGRYEGTAAVKLLNLALLDPVGSERFRREGNVLARLSHPNIARLLDAGVTPGGQPYLVLEHVEGTRIDEYAERHGLGALERIALFRQVLAAVSHAHASLLVHRDLKPSNILVGAGGDVKLLDFGIAKLLEEDGAEASTLTDQGGRALTPQFAAPEQISGGPITTATDVYALGVLFYLLLGRRHPTSGEHESPAQYIVGVLETEPAPLGVTPDLDTIAGKALKKRPGERYPSVAAFAEDIRRYLDHEPVLARPDSLRYRAGKFVRRNRVAAIAAGVVLVTLLGATGFSWSQMREARRQRDEAVAQSRRNKAMSQLQAVLAGDSRRAGGRTLSVLERVGLAERVLRQRFRGEPALVVEVMTDLSSRLYEVGDFDELDRMLVRAMDIARTSRLPEQLALAECSSALGLIYVGKLDTAEARLAEARAAMARVASTSSTTEAECLRGEAELLLERGKPDSAFALFRRALALPGDAQGLWLQNTNGLATALRRAGHTREATEYQRQILDSMEANGYEDTETLPAATAYLTGALSELGEFTAVDSVAGGMIRRQEAAHGAENVEGRLAFLYGQSKLRQGDIDSAARWLAIASRDTSETVLAAMKMWLPPARAQLLLEQGRIAEARALVKTLATDTPGRLLHRRLLEGRIRRVDGDTAGARATLDSILASLADSVRGAPPPYAVYALLTAAEWRRDDGLGAEADSLARIAAAAAGVDSLAMRRSAHVGRAALIRAQVAAVEGRGEEARETARRAWEALRNGFGPVNPYAREAAALAAEKPES